VFTGALAVAAHAVAGGGWPAGGAGVLLAATAAVVGLSALSERASGAPILAVLLAGGQLAGHVALSAAGHSHGQTSTLPIQLMLLTHAVAVVAGAVLVSACERLCQVLSRVARRCVGIARVPVDVRTGPAVTQDGQPLQHVLLLAASISHRGPPVRVRL
jgi:hypothetical protein